MKIKQIYIGLVESDKKDWIKACSSVTLVQEGKNNILVDTGGKGYIKNILDALKKEGLGPNDINIVVNTHSHPDHIWNNAFFEQAEFISSLGILKDKFYWKALPCIISKNIKVISTPGHSKDSCSVIVKDKNTTYAITGDLFYKDQEKISSFEKNVEGINDSRKKIIEMVDYIIPGHDSIFKVIK